MITVGEIMTIDVNRLSPDASLDQMQELMSERSIRHIPIVDTDNNLVGLVTQRDVLAATLAIPGKSGSEDVSSPHLKASDIMRKKMFKVEESTDLRVAALTMQRHKIGSLLVVKDDQLTGIITDSDYVGLAINLLEQMEEIEPPEADNF